MAVFYTGTTGEEVPIVKGCLRVSLCEVHESSPADQTYIPHRNSYSTDVQQVEPEVMYGNDVEIWPTNVVVTKGHTLVLQIAGHNT
jgi:hypothetical protein